MTETTAAAPAANATVSVAGALARIRPALALLDRSARWRWYLLVPLALFNATLESGAAVAVFALIKVAGTPATQDPSGALGKIYRAFSVSHTTFLVLLSVAVALLYVVKNTSELIEMRLQLRRANDAAATVAVSLTEAYLRRPYELFIQRHTSEYIRTITISADVVYRSVLLAAIQFLSECGLAVGVLAVLFASAPVATPIITAALALLMILFYRILRARFSSWGEETQRLSARSLHAVQDILGAAKEIRVTGREAPFVSAFERTRRQLADVFVRSGTALQAPRLVLETGFVIVLVVAVLLLARGGASVGSPLPVLGLYTYAGFRLLPSANRILTQLNNIRLGGAAVDLVLGDQPAATVPPASAVDVRPVDFRREVRLQNATYVYPGSHQPAVRQATIAISRGEQVGIVGATGAGKSTLLDLLLGLLSPQEGSLVVDGMSLTPADLPRWQRHIGYVPQAAYLIDDTITRNVALGVPDDEVDSAAIRRAIQIAQLESLVDELPLGADTVIGERGSRLSGGQRQRVAIARALYHSPSLLVLDEATAGLDNETEAALTAALEAVAGEIAVLIVAHRLSALRNCDRIALMLNGRVDDVGPYAELHARNAFFRAMVEAGTVGGAESTSQPAEGSTSPPLG